MKSPRQPSESSSPSLGPLAALDPQELLAHSEWLKGFALALVRNDAEAEDLAQEAMGVLAASTRKIRDLRAYLKGTVRFLALKDRRSAARRRDRQQHLAAEAPLAAPSADQVTERMDLMRSVLEEVGKLPMGQARVIGLRYLEGLSVAQIAAREGIESSSVRSTLARGLGKLRGKLDEKFGGREAWCAVLAPWSLPLSGGAAGGSLEAGGSSPGVTTNAAVNAAPALVPAVTLGLAMSLKPLLVVAVLLVACLGAWRAFQEPDVELDLVAGAPPSGARSAAMDRAGAGEHPLLPTVSAGGARAPEAGVSPSGSASSGAPLEVATLHGVVVDAITSEPVPELGLRFRYVKDGKPRMADPMITDAAGGFGSGELIVPSDALTLSITDDGFYVQNVTTRDLTMPEDGRIPVTIGPTFTPKPMGVLGSEVRGRRFHVLANGPGIRVNGSVEATFDPSKRDWIRFPKPFGDAADQGPWTLDFRSFDGQMQGTGTVHRRAGVESSPITVDMEPRGAMSFTLDPGASPLPDVCTVEVTSDLLGQAVSVDLSLEGGAMTGRLGLLEPGTYRWSSTRGAEQVSGEVAVHGLETTRVTVRLAAATAWVPRVIVDASAAPGAKVESWKAQFLRLDGSNKYFEPELVSFGAPSAGQFEARMDSLPGGDWSFAVMAPPEFAIDPMIVPIERGGPAPVIRVRAAQKSEVKLTFVHAGTGEMLKPTTVSHFDGMRASMAEIADDGTVQFSAPAPQATYFLAHLDGYRMAKIPYEPGVDTSEMRVELTPGWSNRVLVINPETQSPVEGVGLLLEGESIGKTDAGGEIWLEGDSPPDLIDLDEESKARFEVLISSFSEEGMSAGSNEPRGYMFLVTAK